MSIRATPATSPGSTIDGIDKSATAMGRPPRWLVAHARCDVVMRYPGWLAATMTASAAHSAVGERLERHDVGIEGARQRFGMRLGPVGHHHAADTEATHVTGDLGGRLPRADDQHRRVPQADHIGDRVHGDRGHRHRAAADVGAAARDAASAERGREDPRQDAAVAGDGIGGAANLAENFRFADDQGLEAGADAEQMTRRVRAFDGLTQALAVAEHLAQHRRHLLVIAGLARAPVDLAAVARRQDDRLDAEAAEGGAQRRDSLRPQAHFLEPGHAGRVVIDGQ